MIKYWNIIIINHDFWIFKIKMFTFFLLEIGRYIKNTSASHARASNEYTKKKKKKCTQCKFY